MTNEISKEDLAAYVNDELDEARSAAVKEALAQDPELARAEAELRSAATSEAAESEKMTGERNESSVLFSASQLQALAAGSSAQGETKEVEDESSSLVDIRSLVGGGAAGGDAGGIDELISVGGGYAQPLGAPVLAGQQKEGMSTGLKIGIVVGGLVVLACVVLVVVMLVLPGPQPKADTAAQDAQIAKLMEEIAALKAGGGANTEEMAALEKKLEQEQAAKAAAEVGGAAAGAGGETPPADDKTKRVDKKAGGKAGPSSGGGKTGAQAPSSGKAEAEAPSGGAEPDAPATKPKTNDELDDLLGGSTKAPPKKKTEPPAGGGGGGGAATEKLTRAQVQQGMNAVAGSVKGCGKGEGGKVTVSVVIAPTGRVTSAQAIGTHAGTAIGSCAERAVRRARFPATKSSLSVKYPFNL